MEYLNDSLKRKRQLEERTMRFAVAVFKLLKVIPYDNSMKVIGYQIGKSSSSIGANYREANRAESRDDFIHKIAIVLKETSETLYWLDILAELYPEKETIEDLKAEATEFLRIFQSTRSSLLNKRKQVNRKISKITMQS